MGQQQTSATISFDREAMGEHEGCKVEGYWAVSAQQLDSPFPFPARSPSPWPGKDQFLLKLQEKQKTAKVTAYRGMSHCRLPESDGCQCGDSNGYQEYEVTTAEGTTVKWPEGFEHYVAVHNVKPSKEFYTIIMNDN